MDTKHYRSVICFLGMALGLQLAAACNDDSGTQMGNVVLADKNNYSFTGVLHIPIVETVYGEQAVDIEIDWSKLTEDIQSHDMDPQTDIDSVVLVRIRNLTHAEVETQLSNEELDQSYLDGYLNYDNENDATTADLDGFTLAGTKVDIAEEYLLDDRVYLLLVQTGTTPGTGARALTFMKPTEGSMNTQVEIGPAGETLDFSADLQGITPVAVPREGPYEVDWSELTVNGQGNEMKFENIDGIMLGFYEGESIESLEGKVLDLELLATDLFKMSNKGGTKADLADIDGFDGLTGDGVWIFGLTCSLCQNPAPLFLTVLEPN